jgi:hypothetical protein
MTDIIRRKTPGDAWETVADTGGAAALKWASATLTSAEILDLKNTPVEIIAAPGGRKYIAPILMIWHYRFVAAPYAGDFGTLLAGYGSTIGELTTPGAWTAGSDLSGAYGADLLAQTEDAYGFTGYASFNSWLAAEIEDQPWICGSTNGIGFSGGDGMLTARLLHSIIDGAP